MSRSSFCGIIDEFPLIRVDNFENASHVRAGAYFLSHCHSDHTQGLYSNELLQTLEITGACIYMSEASAAIVEDEAYDKRLMKYVRPLKTFETKLVEIPEHSNDSVEKDMFDVRLLPAAHCLGSVMFLFEDTRKTVLYTGDFRLSTSDVERMRYFHKPGTENEPLQIDAMYVDTTFIDDRYASFPKRSDSVGIIADEISKHLRIHKDNGRVALHTSAKYGYECVFNDIYKKVGLPVYVDDTRWKVYSKIQHLVKGVTNNSDGVKIHNCRFRWSEHLDHKSCMSSSCENNNNIHKRESKGENNNICEKENNNTHDKQSNGDNNFNERENKLESNNIHKGNNGEIDNIHKQESIGENNNMTRKKGTNGEYNNIYKSNSCENDNINERENRAESNNIHKGNNGETGNIHKGNNGETDNIHKGNNGETDKIHKGNHSETYNIHKLNNGANDNIHERENRFESNNIHKGNNGETDNIHKKEINYQNSIQTSEVRKENEDLRYLYIHFSALKWTDYEVEGETFNKLSDNRIDVCFATHCSSTELRYFVEYFSPKKVVGFPNEFRIYTSPVKSIVSPQTTPKRRKLDKVEREEKRVSRELLMKMFQF